MIQCSPKWTFQLAVFQLVCRLPWLHISPSYLNRWFLFFRYRVWPAHNPHYFSARQQPPLLMVSKKHNMNKIMTWYSQRGKCISKHKQIFIKKTCNWSLWRHITQYSLAMFLLAAGLNDHKIINRSKTKSSSTKLVQTLRFSILINKHIPISDSWF